MKSSSHLARIAIAALVASAASAAGAQVADVRDHVAASKALVLRPEVRAGSSPAAPVSDRDRV